MSRERRTARAKSILQQASQEWAATGGHVGRLEAELAQITELVRELPAAGGREA